jgi:hypothetical protein
MSRGWWNNINRCRSLWDEDHFDGWTQWKQISNLATKKKKNVPGWVGFTKSVWSHPTSWTRINRSLSPLDRAFGSWGRTSPHRPRSAPSAVAFPDTVCTARDGTGEANGNGASLPEPDQLVTCRTVHIVLLLRWHVALPVGVQLC